MEDCIESLREAIICLVLDALCSYWQAPVAEGDRDKTTLTNHMGTLRYSRMRLGCHKAPESLQDALHIILSGES